MSPLAGSTATSVGPLSSVWLMPTLPTLPPPAPVQLIVPPNPSSQTNLVPICINNCVPSALYFWTTPSAVPASHTFACASTKQPCTPFGRSRFWLAKGCPVGTRALLPHERTT